MKGEEEEELPREAGGYSLYLARRSNKTGYDCVYHKKGRYWACTRGHHLGTYGAPGAGGTRRPRGARRCCAPRLGVESQVP